jgi:hypothetical protein
VVYFVDHITKYETKFFLFKVTIKARHGGHHGIVEAYHGIVEAHHVIVEAHHGVTEATKSQYKLAMELTMAPCRLTLAP